MNSKTLRQALSDPEFINKLLYLETGKEVKKALLEKDIVLREEDLSEFSKILGDALEKRISDEDLGNISGGTKEQNIAKLKNLDEWINSIFRS